MIKRILMGLVLVLVLIGGVAVARTDVPGITFGVEQDLLNEEGAGYVKTVFGNMDVNGFTGIIGTHDLWDRDERFLYADAKYFVGFADVNQVQVFGVTIGANMELTPFYTWVEEATYVYFQTFNFYVRAEAFDVVPSIYPIISVFGQLDVNVQPYMFNFGGTVGGSVELPW